MAETDFGALDAVRKKLWSDKVWEQALDETLFVRGGMLGKGLKDATNVVHNVNELTATARGDVCVMTLIQALSEDGTAGDDDLTGNEEQLELDTCSITLDQLRHAVINKGRMSEQRTVVRFRSSARSELSRWYAQKVDDLCILTLAGIPYSFKLDGSTRPSRSAFNKLKFGVDVTGPSAGRVFYAGDATSKASLTVSDTLSWDRCLEIRAEAARRNIKSLRSDATDWYVLLAHTYAVRDLKKDPTYKTHVANAEKRGAGNPLFQGSVVAVDGLIVREANKLPTTLGLPVGQRWGAAGDVHGSQCFLLGAQALGMAAIGGMGWEEDDRDYKNKQAVSVGQMLGLKKPVFKAVDTNNESADFGVMSLFVATKPLD